MSEFMRSSDAFTWSMESDPRLRSTIVTVLVLDRSPAWAEVRGRIEQLSHELPMLRQRVVESPLSAPPRWVYCDDFDLDFHMRRIAAPAEGFFDEVLELARLTQMEDFDRARPLWKITLIDGLADGGAAVLCTFHHALSDGVGGIQIAKALYGLSDLPAKRLVPEEDQPQLLDDYRDAGLYGLRRLGDLTIGAFAVVPHLVLDSVRRPEQVLISATELAGSIYRTVRPVQKTGSTLMVHRTLNRRLATMEVGLPALRDAAHRCGGALNDAFIAGIAGGLRRYHEKHHVRVGTLHLSMPINLRAKADAPGGNRITLMRFDVPVGTVDPKKRIQQIHQRTEKIRHEKSLPYTQWIAGLLNRAPRWYIGSILRHVDFVASDVPGIPVPVSLGGAKVLMQYAFGPTIGAAVNVTLVSYVDTCALGINVDAGAIPDIDVFRTCLREGFDEVLSLAA